MWALADKYRVTRNIDIDYNILHECFKGVSIQSIKNPSSISRLSSVGLIGCGTHEIETDDGMIELHSTAKATDLGKYVYKLV